MRYLGARWHAHTLFSSAAAAAPISPDLVAAVCRGVSDSERTPSRRGRMGGVRTAQGAHCPSWQVHSLQPQLAPAPMSLLMYVNHCTLLSPVRNEIRRQRDSPGLPSLIEMKFAWVSLGKAIPSVTGPWLAVRLARRRRAVCHPRLAEVLSCVLDGLSPSTSRTRVACPPRTIEYVRKNPRDMPYAVTSSWAPDIEDCTAQALRCLGTGSFRTWTHLAACVLL